MKAGLLILAGLTWAVVGCAPSEPTTDEDLSRADALQQAVSTASSDAVLDLPDVLGSDWDQVVFLGPYSDNDLAGTLLGFPFDYERVSPWTSTEGGTVVALADHGGLRSWFLVRDHDLLLGCLVGLALPSAKAQVRLGRDNFGQRELVPADRVLRSCRGSRSRFLAQ